MSEGEHRLRITTEADTVRAVFAARELAAKIGMSPGTGASLATAVSELTTNVVKYARGGRVTMRPVRQRERPGLEVVVEDQGPGIENLERAMTDHCSTGGTLGLGLPGTRRLVDEFEIDSRLGVGTRVRVVKWG